MIETALKTPQTFAKKWIRQLHAESAPRGSPPGAGETEDAGLGLTALQAGLCVGSAMRLRSSTGSVEGMFGAGRPL